MKNTFTISTRYKKGDVVELSGGLVGKIADIILEAEYSNLKEAVFNVKYRLDCGELFDESEVKATFVRISKEISDFVNVQHDHNNFNTAGC